MKFVISFPAFLLSFILIFVSTFNSQTNNYPKLDSLETGEYLDSVITKAIDENRAPGFGIVIVKDSSIFFSKGYGYSDLENQTPVDPDKTLFRIASVSKVVTGTVVLIARDEGSVDLNTDVNNYLTLFKVPEKFGKPVTLHNLLTHTPGFDDVYIGKSARTKEEALPLGEFLKEYLPERVIAPGEIFSYSNLGNALAAYVVEEAVNKDFEVYSKEVLFDPLNMKTTSFNLKEFQKENLYKGYYQDDGKFVEFPFDYILDYPAGQMLTPLNEFANFMIMHLNHGRLEGRQIVDSATVTEMHSVQFKHHPLFKRGSGYAFGISELNNFKNLAHGGGYTGISTLMFMFPEIKLGIFAVSNTLSNLPGEIIYGFMNKFYPYEEPVSDTVYPLTDLPQYDGDVEKFTGKYRGTRYSRNTMTKIGVLLEMAGADMPVWKNEEGMIVMYDHKGDERRLIQTEPLVFKSIDDDYHMVFRTDADGAVTHVFTDGTASLEKISWYEEISFNKMLFFILIIIFLMNTIIYFIYKFTRRKEKTKSINRHLLNASAYVSEAYLLYFILFGLLMMFAIDPVEMQIGIAYGLPWYFYVIQVIPFIALVFSVLLIYKMFIAVNVISKAKLGFSIGTVVFISGIAMLWFMNYWNLLGWRF